MIHEYEAMEDALRRHEWQESLSSQLISWKQRARDAVGRAVLRPRIQRPHQGRPRSPGRVILSAPMRADRLTIVLLVAMTAACGSRGTVAPRRGVV